MLESARDALMRIAGRKLESPYGDSYKGNYGPPQRPSLIEIFFEEVFVA